MKVHRTLVISYPLKRLSDEERDAVLKLIPRLDALGNLYARGYIVEPPDIQRKLINGFKYFREELTFSTPPKKWLCRIHPILIIGIRINNEKDRGENIFIDLIKNILKLRGFIYRRAIVIPLKDSDVKYIRNRLSEGAMPKIVRVWIRGNKLCIGIVFERDVETRENFDSVLAIDVNSWKHGISWGLIKDSKITSRGVERPCLRYIDNLYRDVVESEKKYGKLKRLSLHKSIEGLELRRQIKAKRSKIYRYLRDYVNKLVHRLIVKALRNNAKIVIDYVLEESRRELLEEKLPKGLAKIYLYGLPRFVELLKNQAKWYGIPVEFRRLPSSICPVCRNTLIQQEDRTMICNNCGFRADRDEVPLHWALKLINIYPALKNRASDI